MKNACFPKEKKVCNKFKGKKGTNRSAKQKRAWNIGLTDRNKDNKCSKVVNSF